MHMRVSSFEQAPQAVAMLDESTRNKQNIVAKAMAWDLARVKGYLVNNGLLSAERVDLIELEYKRFMALTVMYPEQTIPTAREVDKMWHTHLLFTHDYFGFCEKISGRYIHHHPTVEHSEVEGLAADYTNNTLALYSAVFGAPDNTVWEHHAQICWGS